MNIKEVTFDGFMRFKEKTTIKFNDGITVFYGANGAGKTTIFDGICIALYGKTYRTSGTTDNGFLGLGDLVNKDKKSAKIELIIDAENTRYKIVKEISRSGKTKSYIYKNDEQIAEGKLVYSIISKSIIGLDYTSFRNSTFIAQDEALTLIKANGSERKEILNKLLKLDAYNEFIDIANDKKSEYVDKINTLKGEYNAIKNYISEENSIIQDINYLKNSINAVKNESGISDKIKTLESEISLLNQNIINETKQIERNETNISSLNNEIYTLKSDIKKLKESMELVKDNNTCPVCFSEIQNHDYINKHYNDEISSRNDKMNKNDSEIKKLHEELKELNKRLNEHKTLLSEKIKELDTIKAESTEKISKIEGEIKEKERLLLQLKQKKKEEHELEKKIADIQMRIEAIDKLKEIYREIPKIIIRRITPFIEKEASNIVSFISNNYIEGIKIDKETFKITPIVNGREEEIQFLSGGEALRVGLALRLSISKLVSSIIINETREKSSFIKALFIDEGNFGSLDEEGLAETESLFLKLKEKFKQIIVITHINELKDAIADYAFKLIKTETYSSQLVEDTA
jgi:exonuclease SbcC